LSHFKQGQDDDDALQKYYADFSWQNAFVRQLPVAGLCLIVSFPMTAWFLIQLIATKDCAW
jgi:hypothetical protein